MTIERKPMDAADAVLEDLLDRSGIGNELDNVRYGDPEIWAEIRQTLAQIIQDKMQ